MFCSSVSNCCIDRFPASFFCHFHPKLHVAYYNVTNMENVENKSIYEQFLTDSLESLIGGHSWFLNQKPGVSVPEFSRIRA
jgi:hypothetical protein